MSIMKQDAQDLYDLCDLEKKGYIIKQDMHRLENYLGGLSVEQLEEVFDSLDDNEDGTLTLCEFTEGFGHFVVGDSTVEDSDEMQYSEDDFEEQNERDREYEENQFKQLMLELGAPEAFEDMEGIKELWFRMRKGNADLLPDFEALLGKVCHEVRKSQSEYKRLESALRTKSISHDEDLRKLYEESENQIKTERERLILEERTREKQLRDKIENEIRQKDSQYHEMFRKQEKLQLTLEEANSMHAYTAQERERLEKEHRDVSVKLKEMKRNLKESNDYLADLKKKDRNEKRQRAKDALKMSEGIALDRVSLVQQINQLRESNKELENADRRDLGPREDGDGGSCFGETIKMGKEDNGEDEDKKMNGGTPSGKGNSPQPTSNQLNVMGVDGFGNGPNGIDFSEIDNDCEFDVLPEEIAAMSMMPLMTPSPHLMGHSDESEEETEEEEVIEEIMEPEEPPPEKASLGVGTDPPPALTEVEIQTDRPPSPIIQPKEADPVDSSNTNRPDPDPISSERSPPDGAMDVDAPEQQEFRGLKSKQRMFKVVFVGDSGVGKSSILFRFCEGNFKSTFSATIGVDYHIKRMVMEDHFIGLQLWDTAGQERFRSITKQYYRKADGVVITYDVTHEASFISVRNWIQSVQDSTEEGTVILLLGNKADLAADNNESVKIDEGRKLAEEYGAHFFEVSAKTGDQIDEAFNALAHKLIENEDKDLCNSIQLRPDSPPRKKGGCC